MKALSIIVGMGVMIVSFQNCSKASFGSGDGSFAKTNVLVPVDGASDPDGGPVVAGSDNHNSNSNSNSNGNEQQMEHHENSNHESAEHTDSESSDHQCTKEYTEKDSGDYVACILDGPGKSVKLGIMSEKLGGVNSVAQSVCVTKKACLDLVPAVFKVKGVEERGYCKGNPNVRRLTDAQVKTLLGT